MLLFCTTQEVYTKFGTVSFHPGVCIPKCKKSLAATIITRPARFHPVIVQTGSSVQTCRTPLRTLRIKKQRTSSFLNLRLNIFLFVKIFVLFYRIMISHSCNMITYSSHQHNLFPYTISPFS